MNPAEQRQAVREVLRSTLRGRGHDWAGLVFWSIVEALPVYLSGRLVAQAVDRGFLAGDAGTGFGWLGVLAGATLVGAWATRQTYLRVAALVEPLRDDLVRRATTGSLTGATVSGAPPEMASVARLTQHTEIAREAYASVLMVTQGFVVATVGAVLGLLSLAPEYLLLVLPPLVVGLALFFAALPKLAARQRDAIMAEERIAETATELAIGIDDVVACGGERVERERVGMHVDAHARATQDLARLTAVRTMAVAIGGWAPLILILAAGPWLIENGSTAGMLLGALTYVSQGLHPALESLVRGLGGPGLWLLVTLRRIVEATELPPREPDLGTDGSPRQGLTLVGRPGDLRLNGVSFAYGPGATPVVQDLDLNVRHGEHLVIVGPSGTGKSTLAGIVVGLLAPSSGEVLLGGVPLRHLGRDELTRQRVLVPHQPYVFAGTVRENLTYHRLDATQSELELAVEELGMRDLVDRVGGYDAMVDPQELTAGSRQLIALARAHVSRAPIIVLDEATCHLDATDEARVETAFARREGSLLVVAHRISSAMRAERVLVLDGETTILGHHSDLVARSPLYADMVGLWRLGESLRS